MIKSNDEECQPISECQLLSNHIAQINIAATVVDIDILFDARCTRSFPIWWRLLLVLKCQV